MARRDRRSIPGTNTGLNLTPLLDIIFNLIFFFILATNIRETERFLDITLPQSGSGQERAVEEEIPEIALAEDGTIYLDGDPVTAEELEAELTRAREERNVEEAVLSTDADIPFQRFVDVTDIVLRAGIDQLTPRLRERNEP